MSFGLQRGQRIHRCGTASGNETSGERDQEQKHGHRGERERVARIDAIQQARNGRGGTVSFSVAAYTGKPKKRNGTITVAGQTFTIQQAR